MPWPTSQDYSEAVQNPVSVFFDGELRKGQVEVNNLGLPKPCSGYFAVVFKIKVAPRSWAIKCFTSEVQDQHQRYDSISKHLENVRLPYTVPFTYLPKGIKIQGKAHPLLKMEWIQGDSLGAFIEKNLNNPTALGTLADKWLQMMVALQAAGIAHGDLQHGNVLVVRGEVRLIDYDGMFVPALRGRKSGEVGQRNYQHPARTESDFGPQLDNFSAWVIWLSITALAAHPSLWAKYRGGDECLLLRKEDFVNPSNSEVLRDLSNSPNNAIQALVELFISFTKLPPLGVPSIDENLIRKNVEAWEQIKQQRLLAQKRQREELEEKNRQRLLAQKRQREKLEEENRQRILRQKKKRQIVFAAGLSLAALCGLVALHFWLLANTSLSFEFSLDGQVFPSNKHVNVTVDGKPFVTGDKIHLGRHEVAAEFIGGERFSRSAWTFYGKNNLGLLPLESSKGSLSVLVTPSPATVIVQHDGKEIQKADAPLRADKLPVGDYSLLIRRGDYEERHSVKIERQQRTDAAIALNLGSAKLSSVPADAEFELSGNARRWQGKLPARIEELPVGDYSLVIRRKSYEERHSVKIAHRQMTDENIVLNLGSAQLSSEPHDAEFELLGNGKRWQGKLPIQIDDIPVGTYQVIARRRDWDVAENIGVTRNKIITNKIEFPYSSIEIVSDPPGLVAMFNGVEIAKTPTTLHELKPGQYTLAVSDGENDVTRKLTVGPKEAAQQRFVFHYGAVQLSSSPSGAIVIRRGKEVGKTPLKLDRIPAEQTEIELHLDGYASTNIPIFAREGMITRYAIKLFSTRYISAMKGAQQALAANQFDLAHQCVARALESDPRDPTAVALRTEITQMADQWRQRQMEAKRLAAEAAAKKGAAELSLVSILNPENILASCWNTPSKAPGHFSDLSLVDAAKSNPAAVPVAAATDVVVKSIEAIAWPFKRLKGAGKDEKPLRFNQEHFLNNYRNNVYRYYGNITSVDVNNRTITFASGGKSKQSFVISARLRNEMSLSTLNLKSGATVWISGKLTALDETNSMNRLVLDDCAVYPSAILPAPSNEEQGLRNVQSGLQNRREDLNRTMQDRREQSNRSMQDRREQSNRSMQDRREQLNRSRQERRTDLDLGFANNLAPRASEPEQRFIALIESNLGKESKLNWLPSFYFADVTVRHCEISYAISGPKSQEMFTIPLKMIDAVRRETLSGKKPGYRVVVETRGKAIKSFLNGREQASDTAQFVFSESNAAKELEEVFRELRAACDDKRW